MKRNAYIPALCASVEIARKNETDAPDECAIHIHRGDASRFGGYWWCRACAVRELSQHRKWMHKRYRELKAEWEKRGADIGHDAIVLLHKLEAAIVRQRARRKAYNPKYRRGELPWQMQMARKQAQAPPARAFDSGSTPRSSPSCCAPTPILPRRSGGGRSRMEDLSRDSPKCDDVDARPEPPGSADSPL